MNQEDHNTVKKPAALVAGSSLVALGSMGTAWADYTSSPSPTTVVRNAGGGTAFTGGEMSAAIIGALLVALGAAALLGARWLAQKRPM
jgi:hypothetical protein